MLPKLVRLSIAALAGALISSPFLMGQAGFDPHDLSGVWQFAPGGGGQGPGDNFPFSDSVGTGKVRRPQAGIPVRKPRRAATTRF